MSIAIYTYQDPYRLSRESFWPQITNYPFFCASQTLARGMRTYYRKLFDEQNLRTVKRLTDSLYDWWESTNCVIRQNAAIDNFINIEYSGLDVSSGYDNLHRAFLFNREEVFSSIRTLVELDIDVNEISRDALSPEQRFIVSLYESLIKSQYARLFTLKQDFGVEEIDKAIATALAGEGNEAAVSEVPDTVVIHGVHQFTPIILRTIEEIARYKKVILLFCYQPQYAQVYQSWIDIYSSFDCPMNVSLSNAGTYRATNDLEESSALADDLGKLAEGDIAQTHHHQSLEIIEFDNITEFAGYVADVFDAAKRMIPNMPLSAMREQFYSADVSVNEILKIYYPEQFGERQFLNYPLGHFFIAIANMWDVECNALRITDINSIRECLMSGILSEENQGELSTIFEKALALLDGCTDIDEMQGRLRSVRRGKRRATGEWSKKISRISYYALTNEEARKLSNALNEIKGLSEYFYADFERRPNNFRSFYERLKEYLHDEVLESESLDREFEDIVRRVYQRIEEVDDINASASFECLKSTMSIYLAQQEKKNEGADWIVRGFEQVDGDIMLTARPESFVKDVVYHFACLSDEDVNSIAVKDFTWPLDEEFFTVAQNPVDWKYQVYVRSRKEHRHFKNYALLFGLEFNRARFKLSYVRRDGERLKNPYTRLMMLGAKVRPYDCDRFNRRLPSVGPIEVGVNPSGLHEFDEMDFYKFRICNFRFLLESLIEKSSVYKDAFLLSMYMEVLIENDSRKYLENCLGSKDLIVDCVDESIEKVVKDFPFIRQATIIDAKNSIVRRFLDQGSNSGAFDTGNLERHVMDIREVFLRARIKKKFDSDVLKGKFEKPKKEEILTTLSEEALDHYRYSKVPDEWCKYCPNREICLAFYGG